MALRYKLLHPDVERLRDEHLAPELQRALAAGPDALRSTARIAAPGVYLLPVFDPGFCARLLVELHRRERFAEIEGRALQRPNSMNRYGVLLDEVRLTDLADDLLERVAGPLGAAFFPGTATALDHHHAFTVEYAPEGDRDLALHTDDAEVTLNVCLGREFRGGDLRVMGARCVEHANTPAAAGEEGRIPHAVGHALVHLGAVRHLAEPIESGQRTNLILWCRSTRYRKLWGVPSRCGPACALNARAA